MIKTLVMSIGGEKCLKFKVPKMPKVKLNNAITLTFLDSR